MLIKDYNRKKLLLLKIKKHAHLKVLAGISVLMIYSALLILLGGNLHKEGVFGEVLKPLIKENINIPVNYIKGLLSDPEKLVIDIKHKNYQKLAYKRKTAIEEGVLHPYPEDFVPAKVSWRDKTVKVNMRLKGDLGDHWSRDHKWSFRIKAKDDETIMGMRNFSLQHPRTRGFLNDWLLHRILEDNGFITLRYDFVDVTVNGRHLGIYALEEHFERRLIENNNHLNGPIVRIKDHLLWYLVDPKTGFKRDDIDELYTTSPVDAFNTSRISGNKEQFENFKQAKNLFEGFRRGHLSTHEVFDLKKIAKIFAVIDLFGYRHTTAYSNIRFYYNPITSKLVPVGYDNTFIEIANSIEGQEKKIKSGAVMNKDRLDWRSTFFEDKLFFQEYMIALRDISNKHYLDELLLKVQEEYDEKLNIIYSNFPGYNFTGQIEKLYKNQEYIRSILNPLEGIQVYFKEYDQQNGVMTLQLGNIQLLPVEVINASYGPNKYMLLEQSGLLQAKTRFMPVEFSEMKFDVPDAVPLSEILAGGLTVRYKLLGLDEHKEIRVFGWSYYDESIESHVMRQKPNHDSFEFIEVDDKEKKIIVKAGRWDVDKTLIIPSGYTFICNKGTYIDMVKSSKIISYSPLVFSGTESSPIVIESSDETGQGVVVINTKQMSSLKHVQFKGLSAPSDQGWTMPGVVTFYESDVSLQQSSFEDIKAGQGLSVIRSEFDISSTVFERAPSDSISILFSQGTATKLLINDSNGKGVHLRGSELLMNDVSIVNAKESGLHAIDESEITAETIAISGAMTAVVSKNSSVINVRNLSVADSDIALLSANEKTEFGPARITVDNLMIKNVSDRYIEKDSSTVIIN